MQWNEMKCNEFSMSLLHFKLDWCKVDSCMTIMKRNIKVHFLYLLIHTGLSESKWCIGVKCHMIRDYPAYNRVILWLATWSLYFMKWRSKYSKTLCENRLSYFHDKKVENLGSSEAQSEASGDAWDGFGWLKSSWYWSILMFWSVWNFLLLIWDNFPLTHLPPTSRQTILPWPNIMIGKNPALQLGKPSSTKSDVFLHIV